MRDTFADLKGDADQLAVQAHATVEYARTAQPEHLADALLNEAGLLARLGKLAEARAAVLEVQLLGALPSPSEEVWNLIGIAAVQKEDFDSAEEAFLMAAELSRADGNRAALARSLHNLAAGVLVTRGKFNLALSYMEEAHYLLNEQKINSWGWPWLRAYIHLITGKRRNARQALDELVAQIEPATRIAAGYYFLWARLAVEEGEHEKAREYLRLGLRISTQLAVPDLNLWIRIEHSRYYRKTGNPATAREWAEDSLQLARRSNLNYFSGLSLVELALTCWDCNEKPAALEFLAEASTLFENLSADYDLAYTQYLAALWKYQLEKPQAEPEWVKAVEYITRGGYAFILEKDQENAFPLIAAHLRSGHPETRSASDRILTHLASVPPPPLRVFTLGQFAVWKGRVLIPDRLWQKRKAGELFRYLLLQPNRSAAKESILEALWPERGLDSGNDLLHQSTSALRRILEPDLPDKFHSRYLSFEGEMITLLLPPGSMVDFEVFRQNLPVAIQNGDAEQIKEAISLYTGDLLPTDRYADWCNRQREALSELYQRGLLALARYHYHKLQYADALECCREITALDDLNEDAVMLAMRCYLDLGAAPHALRLYLRLEENLKKELGILPRQEIRRLAESISSR